MAMVRVRGREVGPTLVTMLRAGSVIVVAVVLAACTATADETVSPAAEPPATLPASLPTTLPASPAPRPASPESTLGPVERSTTSPLSPAQQRAVRLCARTGIEVAGPVVAEGLVEASGLVASRTHTGVLWAHNDGDSPGIFAIGDDGSDLGFHPLVGVDAVDIEDMAIASGATGDDLHLADIGDNGAERTSIRVYRFTEPDPALAAPIVDVEVLEFVYPDHPHNAETLLIDERARRLVIVTKEQVPSADGTADRFGRTAPSIVFEGELDAGGTGPVELTATGVIDTPMLETRVVSSTGHPATLLGFGGVPTGGDVEPGGELIALRTYEAVWVWPREPEQTVSDAFGAEPCQVATFTEPQGEAVAFDPEGLVTLGEGVSQPIYRLAR